MILGMRRSVTVMLLWLGSSGWAYCRQNTGGNEFPLTQSQAAAGQQSAPTASGSTAQQNPFPEKQSQAAATPEENSSASGYSSSDANLPAPDVGEGSPTRSRGKLDTFTRDQTMDGRIEDDLKVADLYMNDGNYRGALLRYQDTVQYDPENEEALYGIADAMCRQNMTAEAMARFKSFAKTYPQSRYALKAEKMLAHPNRCGHNR